MEFEVKQIETPDIIKRMFSNYDPYLTKQSYENHYVIAVYEGKQRKKEKNYIEIDLKDHSNIVQINVYIPNRYEVPASVKSPSIIVHNVKQDKNINPELIWKEGYTNVVCLENCKTYRHNITIYVTDNIFPYYEIH